MRVRAQQAALDEEREWEELKRVLVALLLAREGGMSDVGIILRDFAGNTKAVVRPRMGVLGGSVKEDFWEAQREEDCDDSALTGFAEAEIRLLQQVYSPKEIGPQTSWERVRARRGNVTMEGWICVTGAPCRRYQFITVNSYPLLPPPRSTNVLHVTLNHLFTKSTFGTVIDPMARGTKQAMKPRKGADRYPKCILRVTCVREPEGDGLGGSDFPVMVGGEGGTGDFSSGKGGIEGDNLKECVGLLTKLVKQFLGLHGFLPSRDIQGAAREDQEESGNGKGVSGQNSKTPLNEPLARTLKDPVGADKQNAVGRSHPASPRAVMGVERIMTRSVAKELQLSTLSAWGSKVKSGRRDLVEEKGRQIVGIPPKVATTMMQSPPISKTLSVVSSSHGPHNEEPHPGIPQVVMDGRDNLSWQDPLTKQVVQVDSLTGNTILGRKTDDPSEPRQSVANRCISLRSYKRSNTNISTGSVKRQKLCSPQTRSTDTCNTPEVESDSTRGSGEAPQEQGPFVQTLLAHWKNPVFALPKEPPITSLGPTQSLITLQRQIGMNQDSRSEYFLQEELKDFTLQGLGVERLSKECLRSGKVIGQVDKKFILVVAKALADVEDGNDSELLVIIDQHAADERWRVEKLMEELCRELLPENLRPLGEERTELVLTDRGPEKLAKSPVAEILRSKSINYVQSKTTTTSVPPNKLLGYPITPREYGLLCQKLYKKEFASWGVSYKLLAPTKAEKQPVLILTHLPRILLDRALTEPTIPLDLVRSHMWDLSERSRVGLFNSHQENQGDTPLSWVDKMRYAPKKLVEVANSRACRSAVMFGDPLDMGQCEELVARLVGRHSHAGSNSSQDIGCLFPFMCAHGRPSMVPLLKMTTIAAYGAYTISRLGLGPPITASIASGSTGSGTATVNWVGERRYAKVGAEEDPIFGNGSAVGRGGYRERYRIWRSRCNNVGE